MSRTSPLASDPLQILASRAGDAWAKACTHTLPSQRRAIVGAWPGTLTEARERVLAVLHNDRGAVSIEDLLALARTANQTARAAWRAIAGRDEDARAWARERSDSLARRERLFISVDARAERSTLSFGLPALTRR